MVRGELLIEHLVPASATLHTRYRELSKHKESSVANTAETHNEQYTNCMLSFLTLIGTLTFTRVNLLTTSVNSKYLSKYCGNKYLVCWSRLCTNSQNQIKSYKIYCDSGKHYSLSQSLATLVITKRKTEVIMITHCLQPTLSVSYL